MKNKIESISKVVNYIEENLTEKLDLDIVANVINYSKYHLHRMFKNSVGLTIHDYIQRRKLTEAAKLLVFSDKSIIDIALIAGYESQQSFTSVFKAMYKKSPNRYRVNEEFYPLQLRYYLKDNLTKLDANNSDLQQNIVFATMSDITVWMDLVRLVVDGFPCLKEDEYMEDLEKCIHEKRALIIKDENIAIGIMVFCYTTGSIDFLGIHPQYRKQFIAKAFFTKIVNEFIKDKEISITTFRKGDKADTGYREIYKNLGFAESELLVEFGYPTQKFVLGKQVWKDGDDERNPGGR